MATIDHALAADTGLHDGSWARNFFFSHEEEWLSGERALTLSDFPEEYLTDLANEEEAPPSSSSRTIAGKWMSYQWLADRLTDSEVDHHRFPMAFKIGALSMDWAYHDSKVYRLQGFEGLNDTEQDVLIAKVKADLDSDVIDNIDYTSFNLYLASQHGVYLEISEFTNRNNFYRFQPKSNHKKGSKSTAGQAISDRIIKAFLSESPLPPLNLAFIGDKRVAFAFADKAELSESQIQSFCRQHIDPSESFGQEHVNQVGQSQGCAVGCCRYRHPDQTRLSLKTWHIDPRSTKQELSAFCPLHFEIWTLLVDYMGNTPRFAGVLLDGWRSHSETENFLAENKNDPRSHLSPHALAALRTFSRCEVSGCLRGYFPMSAPYADPLELHLGVCGKCKQQRAKVWQEVQLKLESGTDIINVEAMIAAPNEEVRVTCVRCIQLCNLAGAWNPVAATTGYCDPDGQTICSRCFVRIRADSAPTHVVEVKPVNDREVDWSAVEKLCMELEPILAKGLTGEIWRDFLPYCWKLARYQSTDIYKGMSCSALISKIAKGFKRLRRKKATEMLLQFIQDQDVSGERFDLAIAAE